MLAASGASFARTSPICAPGALAIAASCSASWATSVSGRFAVIGRP